MVIRRHFKMPEDDRRLHVTEEVKRMAGRELQEMCSEIVSPFVNRLPDIITINIFVDPDSDNPKNPFCVDLDYYLKTGGLTYNLRTYLTPQADNSSLSIKVQTVHKREMDLCDWADFGNSVIGGLNKAVWNLKEGKPVNGPPSEIRTILAQY